MSRKKEGVSEGRAKAALGWKELAGESGDGLVRVSGVSESHAFISGVRKQAVSDRNQPGLLKSPCWRSQGAWTTKEDVQTTRCGTAFYMFTSHSPPRKSTR